MPAELCKKCKKGYMVAEYSPFKMRDYYYCNNCYKYKEEFPSSAKESIDGWAGFNPNNPDWEEEVAKFVEELFKDCT